jgi:chromatin assembly factor 1 subunit B
MLPGIKSYATCIRFNPFLFKLSKENSENALLDLPYKMVFAVATTDQVLIYTTEKTQPLAVIGNIHYAPINDMAWAADGRLCACSSDGYISIIKVPAEMFGDRLPKEDIPEALQSHYNELEQVDFAKCEQECLTKKQN